MGATRSGGCVIAIVPEAGAEGAAGLTFSLALLSAIAFVVLTGAKVSWQYTFGWIFAKIAGVKIGIKWAPDIHPFSVVGGWSRDVENALGAAAKGYEGAMGFWFHQTARLQGWIADETWKIARDSYHFGGWLVHSYIPAQIHDATHLLTRTVHTTGKVVHVTETKVVHLTRTVYVTAKNAATVAVPRIAIPHVAEWQWIHRNWKALTKAVAAAGSIALAPGLAIPRIFPRLGRLEREAANEAKRLHRAEAWIGATALAAAMANVLGLRSARCLRSGNLGRISRAICGLDSGLFSSLLGLLTAIVAPFSIVALAEANQKLLPGVIDGLGYLIEEAPAELYAVADDVLAEAASLLPGV